jgi:hypothetical protein
MTLTLCFAGLILMMGVRRIYVNLNERFLFKSIGGIYVPICYTLILILNSAATLFPLRLRTRFFDQRAF